MNKPTGKHKLTQKQNFLEYSNRTTNSRQPNISSTLQCSLLLEFLCSKLPTSDHQPHYQYWARFLHSNCGCGNLFVGGYSLLSLRLSIYPLQPTLTARRTILLQTKQTNSSKNKSTSKSNLSNKRHTFSGSSKLMVLSVAISDKQLSSRGILDDDEDDDEDDGDPAVA